VKFNEEQVWGYPRHVHTALRPFKRMISAVEKPLYRRGLLPATRLRLPDFLGLGGPQSGSTWLDRQLREHPDLFLPASEKELHFFDRNFHKSMSSYSRCFRGATPDQKVGEVTPGYGRLSVRQIAFIRDVMPNVRLIYIIRHPVEQRMSNIRRRLGQRGVTTLEGWSEEELKRLFMTNHSRKGLYQRGIRTHQAAAVIRNWWSVFPKEQFLPVWFDDLRGSPEQVLSRVFGHLGVSPAKDWARFPLRQRVNVNPEIRFPDFVRPWLTGLYSEEVHAVRDLLGEIPETWRSEPERDHAGT
jgi:hypothetical protein